MISKIIDVKDNHVSLLKGTTGLNVIKTCNNYFLEKLCNDVAYVFDKKGAKTKIKKIFTFSKVKKYFQ